VLGIAGSLYLLGLALLAGLLLGTVRRAVLGGRWLLVLVLAGYAQILWGSLAYLLPMLRGGGHEQLGEGFRATRSWLGLVAANVVGCNLAFDGPPALTTAAVAVWVLDAVWRAMTVGTRRAPRPRPAA
jgi:hypothetical protein